ncbi:MAG: Ig-like domain-containing protein [Microgenomates group bacterium]
MNKKNIFYISTALIFLVLSISAFAIFNLINKKQNLLSRAYNLTANLSFSPTTIEVNPDEVFNVPISVILVNNEQEAVALDILINFDKNKLTLLNITQEPHGVFKTYLPLNKENNFDIEQIINKANNSGLIEFGMVAFDINANNQKGGLSGSFKGVINPVTKLTFKAKPEATGTTTINFVYEGENVLKDSNVIINPAETSPQDILAKPTSYVFVKINSPTTSPTTSFSPSPTPFSPSPTPFLRDTIPPTLSIVSPEDGSVVNRLSTVNIVASVSDNPDGSGIEKVDFYVNKSLKCSLSVGPFNCNWKVGGKPNTTFTIEVKAYDKAGNIAQKLISVVSK